MSPPAAFQVVDLHDSGSALTVQWRAAPGAHPRQIDADTRSRIGKQVAALEAAERRVGLARDLVIPGATTPAGPALTAAQRALVETLFELLDGPDRALDPGRRPLRGRLDPAGAGRCGDRRGRGAVSAAM